MRTQALLPLGADRNIRRPGVSYSDATVARSPRRSRRRQGHAPLRADRDDRERLRPPSQGAPWLPDYLAEFMLFPDARYDDQVDVRSVIETGRRRCIRAIDAIRLSLQGSALVQGTRVQASAAAITETCPGYLSLMLIDVNLTNVRTVCWAGTMPTRVLHLDAVEVQDSDHWRWVLKDDQGAFLADHNVALERASPKYRGLFDLPGYLQQYAAPDKKEEEERRLVRELGLWIAERLVGPSVGEAIVKRAKPIVAVRVRAPKNAEHIFSLPLDVAYFRGRFLFLQGVRFIFELAGSDSAEHSPVGKRLRILALFSLPPAASALNLRRERQVLRSFVRKLDGAHGFAVDLRVLQYGVTRERLEEVIEEDEGWDIIHFSGHGLPGSLILEKSDGQRDAIPSAEVADLLSRVGSRLKLVVLSACLSAAVSINQTLAWLGAPGSCEDNSASPAPGVSNFGAAGEAAPAVARALIESLECAVLAMRYPVEEEFATALAGSLYKSMLVQGQALPRAAQKALRSAIGDAAISPDMLSQCAMSLFGESAADLTITPPKNPSTDFSTQSTGLAFFPQESDHFVGRVRAMMEASAALAADSECIGVLFHGMAGAGKTSCAVELAYHHLAAARFHRICLVSSSRARQRHSVCSSGLRSGYGATATRVQDGSRGRSDRFT